jgi:hypothetical protein
MHQDHLPRSPRGNSNHPPCGSAAQLILDRLQRAKQTGPGRWIACCPAHDDRTPSLSIRELEDGRVLLHDFGGCETGDVLAAIGMQFSDLFDGPLSHRLPPTNSRIPARDLLELVGHEIDVAGILLTEIVEGRGCSELAWERLAQAAQRIGFARTHLDDR